MKEKIEGAKNWFKKNKVKLIGLGLLTGGAVVGYKMLPDDVRVSGLFKDTDILTYDVLHNKEYSTMELVVGLPGKRIGKVFLEGPEALISFTKDEAIELANEIYKAVDYTPGVIEVGKF